MASLPDLLAQTIQFVFLLWSCLARGVYLLACALEPPKSPPELPELPTVTPPITSAPTFKGPPMLGADVEPMRRVELLKERQHVRDPPRELKISSSAFGRSKRLKSRLRAEKSRHADKRMTYDLFVSPASEADASTCTPSTPDELSEDSSASVDFDSLFSPSSMTSSQSEHSSPPLTFSCHWSPASEVSSRLGFTKPETVSPAGLKISMDIGELGRRRGFTGKPILTDLSNTKNGFSNVLSPFTPGRWTPSARSRLSTVTNFMRPPTPQINVQDTLSVNIQETITQFDPFSDKAASFFASIPTAETVDINNFKPYLAPFSRNKFDTMCWGYRVHTLSNSPKRMETTVYGLSIYTGAKRRKWKVEKAQGRSRVKSQAKPVRAALMADAGRASWNHTGGSNFVPPHQAISLPPVTEGPEENQDLFDPLYPCATGAIPSANSSNLDNSSRDCADAADSIKPSAKHRDGQERINFVKSRTSPDATTVHVSDDLFSGCAKPSPIIFRDATAALTFVNSCKAASKIALTNFAAGLKGLSEPPPHANLNEPSPIMSRNSIHDSSGDNYSPFILNALELEGQCDIPAGRPTIRQRNRISQINMRIHNSATSLDNNSIRTSMDSLSTYSVYSIPSISTPDEPEDLSIPSSPVFLRRFSWSTLALPIQVALPNTNANSKPSHAISLSRPYNSSVMPMASALPMVSRKSHRNCRSKNLDDIIAMLDGFNFDTLGDSPQKFENCTFVDQDFVSCPGIAF